MSWDGTVCPENMKPYMNYHCFCPLLLSDLVTRRQIRVLNSIGNDWTLNILLEYASGHVKV